MAGPSAASRLPLEVIKVIIANLAYDTGTLRPCSLTCCSWYIAIAPHLHLLLFIGAGPDYRKFRWPYPIWRVCGLGLLPLVKKFHIRRDGSHTNEVSPKMFFFDLRKFSAFTNSG